MSAHYQAPQAPGLAIRAWEDIPNLISLLAFFGITAVLFRSLEFALIVTASLGFHEIGHAALLSRLGLRWRIRFGIVGAWTWSLVEERSRLSNLANSVIHMAGPVFSVLLALAAFSAARIFPHDADRLHVLANFSAQVAILNLLPLGALTDGGKVVRRVIAPLGGNGRSWAALMPLLIAALMLLVYTMVEQPINQHGQGGIFGIGLILLASWMAGSIMLEAQRDDPGAKPTGAPVTPVQGFMLLLGLWFLMALALVISAITPFWLTPDIAFGSLQNFVVVLHLFFEGPL
jgi:hypothetical protein